MFHIEHAATEGLGRSEHLELHNGNTRHVPCTLLGYTVGESRHTKGWPNRFVKFYHDKQNAEEETLIITTLTGKASHINQDTWLKINVPNKRTLGMSG